MRIVVVYVGPMSHNYRYYGPFDNKEDEREFRRKMIGMYGWAYSVELTNPYHIFKPAKTEVVPAARPL